MYGSKALRMHLVGEAADVARLRARESGFAELRFGHGEDRGGVEGLARRGADAREDRLGGLGAELLADDRADARSK